MKVLADKNPRTAGLHFIMQETVNTGEICVCGSKLVTVFRSSILSWVSVDLVSHSDEQSSRSISDEFIIVLRGLLQ